MMLAAEGHTVVYIIAKFRPSRKRLDMMSF